jgi:4-carboxymuconolactone decarboxylase
MRYQLIGIGLIGLLAIGLAMAQDAKAPELHLRGDRFKPLTYAEMNPQQKTMIDHVLASPRGSTDGPFNIMLRSPVMGDLAQQYGAYMRYHSSLSPKLNEFVILITARSWNAQFEWYAHRSIAQQNGISPAIIEAVAAGKRPASMQPDEEAVYNFCTELLNTRQISDATFAAMKDKFGERGVVDTIGVMGYYHLVSALLNVDRYPLPAGAKPELKPLK